MNILHIEAELMFPLEYPDRGSFIFFKIEARFLSNLPRVTFSLYVQKIDVSQFLGEQFFRNFRDFFPEKRGQVTMRQRP